MPLDDLLVHPTVRFSDRNAASPNAAFGPTAEFVKGIPFSKVFHDGSFAPVDRDEIVARRQAEIQIHHSFRLSPKTFLLVRSAAELHMLRDKLPASIPSIWDNRISIATRAPAFFKRWLFVERIERQDNSARLYWNPQATLRAVGPVALRVTFENLDTGHLADVHQPSIPWDGMLEHDYRGFQSYPWRITVRVEDTVAFTGTLFP